jgi:hypothetical protein
MLTFTWRRLKVVFKEENKIVVKRAWEICGGGGIEREWFLGNQCFFLGGITFNFL